MGFLNPGLLWFALGGAIPVIIHLLHRQKYKRIRWAAMEFLLAALKKTQRRLRLENLILLLLRILIMIILAMAISRPFLSAAPRFVQDSNTHHFFVIDTSYSMAYKKGPKTYLDLAREQADKLLDTLGPKLTEQDKITVILGSTYPEVYVVYASKLKSVKEAVAAIRPSHYGSSMYQTFLLLQKQVEESRNIDKRVYVFTDLQKCGWESPDEVEAKRFGEILKKLSGMKEVKVGIYDVTPREQKPESADNRGLVRLWVEDNLVESQSFTTFHIDLYNWSAVSYPSVDIRVMVDGSHVGTATTQLPPNSPGSATLRYRFHEPGPHFVEAAIDPDHLDLDDRRFLALDVKSSLTALIVDGKPLSESVWSDAEYLKRMLSSSGYAITGPQTAEMFTADDLDKHDFVVLCNVQTLTQDKVAKLEDYAQRGGGLLITCGDRVDRGSYNELLFRDGKGLLPAWLGEAGGSPAEIQPRVPLTIKEFNAHHPVFAPFRSGRGPYSLIFYQHFRLEKFDPMGVLATLDDPLNSPLLVEKKFGEGKVMLYTSTINNEWDAGVGGMPAFAAIVWSLAPYLSSRPLGAKNLQIGDLIQHSMTAEKYAGTFMMDTPSEGQTTIAIKRPQPDSRWFTVFYPGTSSQARQEEGKPAVNEGLKFAGKYALVRPRTGPGGDDLLMSYFACNLPPRTTSAEEITRCEGNLETLTVEDIRRRYPDFKFHVAEERESAVVSESQATSRIWKYLLYLLCGFLALETFLAWYFGRAKQ